ncbi:uncharacterized protein PAC_08169 [Phialocephala subalpina]|uniref:Uncharacterized protein n=1 Tax=Phialocephala subalpina TaxID=576137 RepID=A0A1L7WZT2_9HELO|nr:uncharacterized protein PAC_08169 [Phialocephala subalpina]
MSDAITASSPLDEVTWPDRRTLLREMGLSTDEMSKAKHIKHILKLLKLRKQYKHHDDSPAEIVAQYYSVATHMFWNTFKTVEDFKFNTHSKVKWFLVPSHQKMITHPDVKSSFSYFIVMSTSGKSLRLYQGPGSNKAPPVFRRSYDVHDRADRKAFVDIQINTLREWPPAGNTSSTTTSATTPKPKKKVYPGIRRARELEKRKEKRWCGKLLDEKRQARRKRVSGLTLRPTMGVISQDKHKSSSMIWWPYEERESMYAS